MMLRQTAGLFAALAISLTLAGRPADSSAADNLPADVLSQDFRGAQCDTEMWTFISPDELTHAEAEGLLIEIPATARDVASSGVAARFGLRGDFQITAHFELLDVPTPATGFGAGATISILCADGQGASLQRVNRVEKEHAFVCHRAIPQPDGGTRHVVEIVRTDKMAGRMRLERHLDELRYLFADEGSQEFEHLHHAHFTDADVRLLHLAAQTGEGPNAVKVRWTNFEARADEVLTEIGTSKSGPRVSMGIAIGLTAAAVIAAIALKAAARRRAPT